MIFCKKGHRVILATATINEIEPDAEPFEAGAEEKIDLIETEITVGVHYCPECREVLDAWIEYPRQTVDKAMPYLDGPGLPGLDS